MTAIQTEVARHFFASVAEEMGVALMRAAFSPNIKERRDFSCAVFDATGRMLAQAAHIPVHLGSTPMSVEAARQAFTFRPGLHVLLNDPYAGGTHLPDITLVSPVFDAAGDLRFLVANRAHHADVGGISPGSMPLSRHIDDEGFRFGPTPWDEAFLQEIATTSRTPDERRGDLAAQLAANLRGVERLSHPVTLAKFGHLGEALLDHSERMMRAVIRDIPDGEYTFEDCLDGDGFSTTPIVLRCSVKIDGDRMVVDLRDCPDQVVGPVNVPRAVTVSSVLFVARCLGPVEMPSNAGYMRCVEVLTRTGSVLDARWPAPVAIGNVETSQRVADLVFGALSGALPDRIAAASQGTMNNVIVGGQDASGRPFAYYETIGGGMGAGPGFIGASAIHSHMTNTLNTPVEALEHAYPFWIKTYAVRRGSGGAGQTQGGDGVVKTYRFLVPATVTLMTERRRSAPWGLAGGGPGMCGANRLVRGGRREALPDKTTFEVFPGDGVEVLTPGGGGFGAA